MRSSERTGQGGQRDQKSEKGKSDQQQLSFMVGNPFKRLDRFVIRVDLAP